MPATPDPDAGDPLDQRGALERAAAALGLPVEDLAHMLDTDRQLAAELAATPDPLLAELRALGPDPLWAELARAAGLADAGGAGCVGRG
jgi:hypothetical protein